MSSYFDSQQSRRTGKAAVIVGGGIMGCDVAAIFAVHGYRVHVIEPDGSAASSLPDRHANAINAMEAEGDQGELTVASSLAEVDWRDVDIVVECAPEDLSIKQTIFRELDKVAPCGVPLASNSSSFPISLISEGLLTRNRMLGLHFFMPAHLVPAVEVIKGGGSDADFLMGVYDLMRSVGKRPVLVKKDVPGFLANRIQHALMREAISLVDEGFASAEDVDLVVRYGFGFRYVAAGPLLQKDLAGIDIHCAAAATMYPHLNNDKEPAHLMQELVERGDTGMKSRTMRGFYQWNAESMASARSRYEIALQKAMRILRDEEIGLSFPSESIHHD